MVDEVRIKRLIIWLIMVDHFDFGVNYHEANLSFCPLLIYWCISRTGGTHRGHLVAQLRSNVSRLKLMGAGLVNIFAIKEVRWVFLSF